MISSSGSVSESAAFLRVIGPLGGEIEFWGDVEVDDVENEGTGREDRTVEDIESKLDHGLSGEDTGRDS